MNARNIIILAVVLALLGGALWYRKTGQPPADLVTADSLHRFAPDKLDPATVDTVELTRPGSPMVRLEKKDGQWRIPALGDAPASSQSVEHLLNAVMELRGEHRSSDPAIVADYNLADSSALSLSLSAGHAEELRLLFGKGDFRNVFLRAANSTEVYVAPGAILGNMGAHGQTLSEQFWIETTLLSLNWADIQELRVTTPVAEAALKRISSQDGNATSDDKWEFTRIKGEGLTQTQLESALTVLDSVSVHEALPSDSPDRTKLDTPTHRLEIITTTGPLILEAFKEEAGALVRKVGSPHIYRMHDTVFDRLFPAPATDTPK